MKNLTFEQLPEAVTQLYDKLSSIESILIEKSTFTQSEVDQLLTVQQAAEFLNLSVPTIYGYVQKQEIPVCKRSKRLYFSKQQLTEWIKSGRKKTVAEIEAEAEKYLSNHKKRANNG